MKMTIDQFRQWAEAAEFQIRDSIEAVTVTSREEWQDVEGEEYQAQIDIPVVWGCATRTMTAQLPDGETATIEFNEYVEWDGKEKSRLADDYKVSPPEDIDVYGEGITLFDEDGDELGDSDKAEVIREVLGDKLEAIDYDAILPPVATDDIDYSEESEMELITLINDNAPDLRFNGELVAKTSSSPNNASSCYSGSVGRWMRLELYRTAGGKFVCSSTGYTQWQGEKDRRKAAVCETEADVIEFFGHGWLAKDLYEEAGIVDAVEVD